MRISLVVLAILSLLLPTGNAQADSCTYTMSQPAVTGGCPAGQPAAGSCEISGSAESFALTLTSGAVCSPAAACTYDCRPNGDGFTCTNSVVADNEGGRVTNTLELSPAGGDSHNGSNVSQYVHPSGFSCKWVSDAEVTAVFPVD